MSSITEAIEKVTASGAKAFVPYIMAGDGGLATLKPTILKLQKLGVTAIEVGIPFTDPVADGPTIEQAGMRALAHGVTLRKVLAELTSFASDITVPLIAMTYFNPLLAYNLERFATDAYAAGVRGIIVPDVPLEESQILRDLLNPAGIDVVQLISLTSTEDRITRIAQASQGFIYAITVNGITGARTTFVDDLSTHFGHLKQVSTLPVLAGFGISTPDHVRDMGVMTDGVIVGSAIVKALHEGNYELIADLVKAAQL